MDVNRGTIECVYAYYGRLYLDHARLQWAGMASLIGPSFYAGFLDLGFLPDQARRLLEDVNRLITKGKRRVGQFVRRDARIEELVVGDLGFFETTFLTMQRKIFEDQALMHEAYLGGGLDAIRALGRAGIIDTATERAWEQIDGGEPAQVHAGNRTLLYREQHDIIDRFYVDMRDHSPPSGRLFTYLMTLAGAPAVPGAKSYGDVFPLTLVAPLWGTARLALRTPLAAGNLALFTNRWMLIEENTLPVYQRLIAEHVAEVRALIERPVARRAGRFRLVRRGGSIVLELVTDWRLGLESRSDVPLANGEEVHVDLTKPPTRADAALGDRDSRIWTNLQRRPFRVSVALPAGRTFSVEAVLVVLLSPEPATDPTRLTVKLPAMDLDGVQAVLADLAGEWGLDEAEIGAWAARAAAVTTASHAYSTRVFAAQPVGFVRLEFQLEHHVERDGYVLDALFSWDA